MSTKFRCWAFFCGDLLLRYINLWWNWKLTWNICGDGTARGRPTPGASRGSSGPRRGPASGGTSGSTTSARPHQTTSSPRSAPSLRLCNSFAHNYVLRISDTMLCIHIPSGRLFLSDFILFTFSFPFFICCFFVAIFLRQIYSANISPSLILSNSNLFKN